jgi:ribosomal protein L7/L12
MTPQEKAKEVFVGGAFDTKKVLGEFVNVYPQIFLMLAEQHKAEPTVEPTFTSPIPVQLTPAQHSEVMYFINAGEIVNAIKRVRSITGAGLKDSKTYVDKFRVGTVNSQGVPFLEPYKVLEVATLLRSDRYVAAIKHVRQETGAGLKEAKDCVDAIRGRM